jgi:hypothetical protein
MKPSIHLKYCLPCPNSDLFLINICICSLCTLFHRGKRNFFPTMTFCDWITDGIPRKRKKGIKTRPVSLFRKKSRLYSASSPGLRNKGTKLMFTPAPRTKKPPETDVLLQVDLRTKHAKNVRKHPPFQSWNLEYPRNHRRTLTSGKKARKKFIPSRDQIERKTCSNILRFTRHDEASWPEEPRH